MQAQIRGLKSSVFHAIHLQVIGLPAIDYWLY